MTTINLPSVQSAPKPAAGKQAPAGNGSEENGSFQEVLAAQANKAKSDANEPARSARADKAETKPHTKSDTKTAADQAQAQEGRKDQAEAGKDAVVAEQALPLLAGLTEASTALGGKGTIRVDGVEIAATPRTAEAAQAVGLAVPQAVASERGSQDVIADAGAGATRKTAPGRFEDPKAIVAAADERQPPATLSAATDKTARAGDTAQTADFAKILAAREAPAPAVPSAAALQTAAVSANGNGNAAATMHVIEPRLGSRDWGQAVSQKVVWMVGAMEQSATLTLNPPDLGPLQVVIQVHNDQADAAFMSDNPEVRQALQDSLGTLRNMMSGAGIQLGDASISAGNPGQEQLQQQFQQSQRQAANGRQTADSGQQRHLETPLSRQGGGSGLVDTFA